MICPNCKQEIEDGSIYCEHCGHTIQIVPDYNALDDVLPSILEENPKPAPKVGNQKTKEHSAKKTAHPKTGQQRLVIGVCCGVLVVIIGIFAWQSYLHSYTYFMNRGEALESRKEYGDAKKYYDLAYKKNDTVDATLACGRIAYRMGDYDTAETYLLSVAQADTSNTEAFKLLCKIYEANQDFTALEDLATLSSDEEVLAIIDEALIFPPGFSIEGGAFDDDLTLYLSAPRGNEIYYTIDGSNPDEGLLYDEEQGISLTDGTTRVRAVCKNESGKFGFEAEEVYKISYKAPDYPEVTPSNGTFYEETFITITSSNEEDRIYYTWDGSTPTAESSLYTEPIPVPAGNNILSIIVINRHDLISEVLHCNYVYRP